MRAYKCTDCPVVLTCVFGWLRCGSGGLRHGDGVTDAAEGVVAAVAAAGGHDEVVFAAWDRVVEDDFG